jgi:hypothetical protein
MASLVDSGENRLKPLLAIRDWLRNNRSEINLREDKRRNGVPGKGPYKIDARVLILKKLFVAEILTEQKLISEQELNTIQFLWNLDGFNVDLDEIEKEVFCSTNKLKEYMKKHNETRKKQIEALKNICEKHQVNIESVLNLLNAEKDKNLLKKRYNIQQLIETELEK